MGLVELREVDPGFGGALHADGAPEFGFRGGQVVIRVGKAGEEPVDARSILGVMALGAKFGEEVLLTAEGDGADAALNELVALLSRDLDAEE